MPNFVVLGCLEVGEKFRVVVGAFPYQKQRYTNLSWVRLRLGWAVTIIYSDYISCLKMTQGSAQMLF